MSAQLIDGRGFRVLTVIDQFTRECLAIPRIRNLYSVPPSDMKGGVRLKGITSRIERLEGQTKEVECAGCNQAAEVQMAASLQRISIEEAPCPICGNPYPQMSIRYAREMLALVSTDEEGAAGS
jgi:hypothetical protein